MTWRTALNVVGNALAVLVIVSGNTRFVDRKSAGYERDVLGKFDKPLNNGLPDGAVSGLQRRM